MLSLSLVYSESKTKVTSFFVWISVWLAYVLMMAPMFNTFMDKSAEMEKFMATFDEGILKAFNMGTDYLSTVEKFAGGEFLTFFEVVGAIVACFMGVNMIAGKIADKTIANVLTKKLSRPTIYLSKLLVNIAYLTLSSLTIALLSYLAFVIFANQENISLKFFLVAFMAYNILHLFFAVFAQMLGVFFEKSQAQMISAGIAVGTWIVHTFGLAIENFPEILRRLSPFYYINDSMLTNNYTLDFGRVWVLFVGIIVCTIIGMYSFGRKDVFV